MRAQAVFILALFAVALQGCGGGGVAGTYVLDESAMRETVRAQAMKDPTVFGPLENATGDEKAEIEKQLNAEVERQVASMKMELNLKDDGTYTVTGGMGGEKFAIKGTWTQDGDNLSFETTEKDGEKLEEPQKGTARIDGDTLFVKPEPGIPFEIAMKKK